MGSWRFFIAALAVLPLLAARPAGGGECTVLAVMSYEADFPWTGEIMAGIHGVLDGRCTVVAYYLNTKTDYGGGPARAKEAFALYRKLAPDGVIAADDDAQAMFVVPYLAGKVATPVTFCGVNAEPATYGYPAANVSGVLERLHVAETIALAQQLVPSIKTVAFLMKDTPSARAFLAQVKAEQETYSARIVGTFLPANLAEALAMLATAREVADLLFVETLEGLPDADGKVLSDREVIPRLAAAFGKATAGSNDYAVRDGLLCAVVKSGREQGEGAAHMLLKAMAGVAPASMPPERNRLGRRVINVTVLRSLGIEPRPIVLSGAELVRTGSGEE